MGDITPPTVVATTPNDGATAMPAMPTLAVSFDEPMDATTITTTATTTCGGSVQLSADGFVSCVPLTMPTTSDDVTFGLAPTQPLSSATIYALRVTTAAQDASGNPLGSMFQTASGFTVRYAHTIVVDGVDDFDPAETIPSSTAGGDLHLSYDDTTLFVGLTHPDVQTAGSGNKFVYFLFSTDTALATGNATSSDAKAKFGAAGTAKLTHHVKTRIDGPSYTEFRTANGVDWSTDWTANGKSVARAAGFVEVAIALSELGSPANVVVTAYTVDYAGDNGNGWLYNMLAGATDGSGATPRDLHAYLWLTLPTSSAPSTPSFVHLF